MQPQKREETGGDAAAVAWASAPMQRTGADARATGSAWKTRVAALACFCAAGIGVLAAAKSCWPRPYVEVLDEKLADFRADTRADTILIGSSRIYHGIIPDAFDAQMAGAGIASHSYNLGVDGMVAPESFHALQEALAVNSGSAIKWALIELPPHSPRIDNYLGDGVRTIWWHDWTDTVLSMRSIAADSSIPSPECWRLAGTHARLFLRSTLNLGRGADALSNAIGSSKVSKPAAEKARVQQIIGSRGFAPMKGGSLENPDKYHADLAAYRKVPVQGTLAAPFRDRLRTLVHELKQKNVTPVFVITPSLNARSRLVPLRDQGIDADLISLNDADKFPSLFEDKVRVDGAHLNEAGARELTRLLALEFARLRLGQDQHL